MNISDHLQRQKEDSELSSLKNSLMSGVFVEQKKKQLRASREKQLTMLLQNALFLENDKKRKDRWLKSIPFLKDILLNRLIDATIRENLRYKERKRNLLVELNKKRVG